MDISIKFYYDLLYIYIIKCEVHYGLRTTMHQEDIENENVFPDECH